MMTVLKSRKFNRQKRTDRLSELKWSKTGWQVNLAEENARHDGAIDRQTGGAVRKPEKSGSHPDLTARLAGVCPQRHTGLCPQTAVHPLIINGSKLFFFLSKISPTCDPTKWCYSQ